MRIGWMEWTQLAISVAAAYGFSITVGRDPLLTPQAWLLGVLVTGFGAAWMATHIIVRLAHWRPAGVGRAAQRLLEALRR